MSKQLIIYTDGSARGNPGPGGYGVVLQWGTAMKEVSQGYRHTTNNRMELMAVIVGLEMLTREGVDVVIYSDSSYVVNAVEKGWLAGWVKKGFKDKKNPDLWQRYLNAAKKHRVKFVWVKGHADNRWNNRCDELATAAADSGKWLVDQGYELAEKGQM
ncbi:MAG: ribonuclease HI [Sphingobacteriales bacterium]|nr:MAG: ribonuclease HI [Sphingobacteriales bacterium]